VTVDPARFPTLAEYLDRLPSGLLAYPDCRSKAGLVRSALEGHDLAHVAGELPDPVRAMIVSPPPLTQWVPAVLSDAVFHVVCDTFYPTPEDMLRWTYDRTMAMAKSPTYRTLVRALGPPVFFKIAERVHGMFQRGTELEVELAKSAAKILLKNPAHLHSDLNRLSNVALIRAVVELTGGQAGGLRDDGDDAESRRLRLPLDLSFA
jgi:hypothetical protein